MPFYEYECSSCKFYKEVMQKVSDAPLKKCPSCGRNTLKKLISVPVFRLKGAGWYETDFKTDQEKKRNLAEAREKEEVKAENKTEQAADPSAKAETKTQGESKPKVKAQAGSGSPSRSTTRPRRKSAAATAAGTKSPRRNTDVKKVKRRAG